MRQIGPGFSGVADHIDALTAERDAALAEAAGLREAHEAAMRSRDGWIELHGAMAAEAVRLREAMHAIIARSETSAPGTSKVKDMAAIASAALAKENADG
jgi:hypothetical protein